MKHRLTGAAVLIGFAVIVLPMLLGGPEPGPRTGNTGDMPGDSDTKVFRSNITPIGGETPNVNRGESADDGGTGRTDTPPPSEEIAEQDPDPGDGGNEPGGDEGASAAQTGSDDDAGNGEQVAARSDGDDDAGEPAQTVERGWIVQVGTFRDPDNVKKLSAALENQGFGSSTTEVETSEGMATRVWVGPFATRVEAARAKTRVKQRTGTEGLIVAYP